MATNKKTGDRDNISDSALGAYMPTQRDSADGLSVSSRQRIRDKMAADVEAFLAGGGKIEQLDITMSAEKLNQQRGSHRGPAASGQGANGGR